MIRLNSADELQALLRVYGRKLSNNYLLRKDIIELINAGNLSYRAEEDAIYLYERRQGYRKLFFQLNTVKATLAPGCEPLVANVVSKGAQTNGDIKEWLINNGFTLGVSRIHLAARHLPVEPSLSGVSPATKEEADKLFGECFVWLYADLPLSGYGELLAVRGEDGAVKGILHCQNPFLIAVDKAARRQGIGTKLLAAYAAWQKTDGCKLWMTEGNETAYAFYRRHGFTEDGMKAECFIRK